MSQRPPGRAEETVQSHRSSSLIPPAVPATKTLHYNSAIAGTEKKRRPVSALPTLILLALVLELVYLALYPLLAASHLSRDLLQQAWQSFLPPVSALLWTTALPALPHLLNTALPWIGPATEGGRANLFLLLLILAFLLTLFAVRTTNRLVQARSSARPGRAFFWIVLLFTTLPGITMLCAPLATGVLTQDMLLYSLYGRMIVLYRVNPFTVTHTAFPHDSIAQLLGATTSSGVFAPLLPASAYGPVWLDLSLLVALFVRDNVAATILSFRLIGLLAHLGNTFLLWRILGRLKPETRVPTTLLYAWNPLVLLVSVAQMHVEVVIVFFFLLAIFFLLRNSFLLCLVLVLLAVLIYPLCLPALPIFLSLVGRKVRLSRSEGGSRLRWWCVLLAITLLMVGLAYAPYWQGWGIEGFALGMQQVFWPDYALNSLDAALLNLPVALPQPMQWVIAPRIWTIVALVVYSIFLLFSAWLVDTVELVFFCCSWVFLLLVLLHPVYWAWFIILPFTLSLGSTHRSTLFLTLLLALGALFSLYCWQWSHPWQGQGLVSIGFVFLIWGWTQFVLTTWRMSHQHEQTNEKADLQRLRSPWLSRASWPARLRNR
jgi:hypothetical protein